MTDNLHLLCKKMNVTGAEKELADHIFSLLKGMGQDPEFDDLGNVILFNKKFKTPDLMICCPMDNPGFLTLYAEKSKAFLFSTQKISKEQKELTHLLDSQGALYKIQEKNETPEYFTVKKKEVRIGEVFRIPSNLTENNGVLSGFYASRYLLLQCCLNLAELVKEKPIALCFTVGFHSPAKSENCLAKLLSPKKILLLNTAEEKNLSLLVKDGKHFSDEKMKQEILELAKKSRISLVEKVCEDPVTKADTVAIPGGVRLISLALPCQNKDSMTESVKLSKAKCLTKLLSEIIKGL